MILKTIIISLDLLFALHQYLREIQIAMYTPILMSMSESLGNLHDIADDSTGIGGWNAGEGTKTTHIKPIDHLVYVLSALNLRSRPSKPIISGFGNILIKFTCSFVSQLFVSTS